MAPYSNQGIERLKVPYGTVVGTVYSVDSKAVA